MSAFLYPSFFSNLANESVDWTDLNPRAVLLSQAFVYDPALQFRDQLDENFVIEESPIATNLTYNNNVGNSLPFTWLQLSDNRTAYHIVVYDDVGDAPYSELLFYLGADSVEGLPSPMAGEDYFLYPVSPPGGFFSLYNVGGIVGPIGSYSLAFSLALGEGIGGVTYAIPVLVFGRRLIVSQQNCFLPDVIDSDECCGPVIRNSPCA